jgi:hypothetical protein
MIGWSTRALNVHRKIDPNCFDCVISNSFLIAGLDSVSVFFIPALFRLLSCHSWNRPMSSALASRVCQSRITDFVAQQWIVSDWSLLSLNGRVDITPALRWRIHGISGTRTARLVNHREFKTSAGERSHTKMALMICDSVQGDRLH